MFIKKFNLIFILIFFASSVFAQENIFIQLKVNDHIVTNVDIKKEVAYMKILNPNISQLDDLKTIEMAKKSLVNEIIKKDEINKFLDLKDKEFINEKLLNDLINKLNLNEDEFQNLLIQNQSYTLKEVKNKLKIDLLWNDLVYYRFKKQIKIDNEALNKKVNELKSNVKKEYLLSEIVFEKKSGQSLKELTNKIQESIKEIGFKNTANIFSITSTSKFGGSIGWVDENNLSNTVIENLKKLNAGQITNVIQAGNDFLMLKIDEIKTSKVTVDKEVELNKLIQFETNRQLNQFSKIYFNKISVNYSIDEK